MNLFSYKIEHDYGLAPNPFGGYCTLAVCRPQIRKNANLKIGDWIIGTGSKKLKKLHSLIYAMKVTEKLTFQEYWEDSRFEYKKPNLNASLVRMFGDNFYHKNKDSWIQEKSVHSLKDAEKHTKRDLGGKFVLISDYFYYLGDECKLIPEEHINICCDGRGMKYKTFTEEQKSLFIKWLESNFERGIIGDPINWEIYNDFHNQLNLF